MPTPKFRQLLCASDSVFGFGRLELMNEIGLGVVETPITVSGLCEYKLANDFNYKTKW